MAKATRKKTRNDHKNTMILCIVCALIFLIIGGIWTAVHWDYMILGKTKQLNNEIMMGHEPEKGDYVTLNVMLVLGNYAETKHRINGFIPIGTDQHYAVVLFDEDNMYVMSVTLKNKKDIERLESLVNASWNLLTGESDQWPGESVELTGKITTMDSQIKGYYNQQLSQAGVTTEYFTKIYDLTLDATESRLSKFLYLGFFLLLAVACFLGALGSRKQMKKLEDIQAIARENASDPSLNPFLNGGNGGNGGNPGANPYTADNGATTNPYAASMNNPAEANPYGTAGAGMSPYGTTAQGTPDYDTTGAGVNPYNTPGTGTTGYDTAGTGADPYNTTGQTTPDAAPYNTGYTSDSATSDSYNSDSYNPN